MKPLGPIPNGFAAVDGELAIDGVPVSELAERAGGTPLFVYSSSMIGNRVARLRAAMPAQLAIHYAVQANPFPPVLPLLRELVVGFDFASVGEMAIVRAE